MPRTRVLLILYGILNAASYSALLPLWEGFDEGYHYGYVQLLSTNLKFPVLGQAFLSREIWNSYELTPVSHYLQPFTKAPVNFHDYFALSEEERRQRRRLLESIPASAKYQQQLDKANYEVSQSPLPYVWMAAIDRALADFPITARVLWLRLLCSMPAVLLVVLATVLLSRQLLMPDVYAHAALFCVLSSQMLYATICHICNDWLSVALLPLVIWALIAVCENGSNRNCLILGLLLAAGLLAKAYLLVLVPLVCTVVAWGLWRRRINWTGAAYFAGSVGLLAGPWYFRNLLLYQNLSATVESTSGVGRSQLLQAALELPWWKSIGYMAHSSLWTGNNSFTTFSSTTLDITLLLLAFGIVLCLRYSLSQTAVRITIYAIILFSLGLAYISVTFYASSKGGAFAAVPWYMQGLLVPVVAICFLGLARWQRWGRWCAIATVLLWAYVAAASWFAKLVPLYGGFEDPHVHLEQLLAWYVAHSAKRDSILSTLCPAPLPVLYVLLVAVLGLIVVCTVTTYFSLSRASHGK